MLEHRPHSPNRKHANMSRAIEYDLTEIIAGFNIQPKKAAKKLPDFDYKEAEIIGLAASLSDLNQQITKLEARKPYWDGESARSPEFLRWWAEHAALNALYEFALSRIFEPDFHTPRITAIRVAIFNQTDKALRGVGIVSPRHPLSLSGMAMLTLKGIAGQAAAFA